MIVTGESEVNVEQAFFFFWCFKVSGGNILLAITFGYHFQPDPGYALLREVCRFLNTKTLLVDSCAGIGFADHMNTDNMVRCFQGAS